MAGLQREINRAGYGWKPGQSGNPAGRPPGSAIEEARRRFAHRIPELFSKLFELVNSKNENVSLSATRELLDRLIGKPQQFIEAVTTKVDVGAMYLQALQHHDYYALL